MYYQPADYTRVYSTDQTQSRAKFKTMSDIFSNRNPSLSFSCLHICLHIPSIPHFHLMALRTSVATEAEDERSKEQALHQSE